MKIEAVIFDLDGTITEPFLDFDQMRSEMGLVKEDGPLWEAMTKLDARRRQETERILDRHEQLAIENSTLNIGVRQTITKLKELAIKSGILTRNTAKNAHSVLKKHNLQFDAVIGREDGPIKPDPFGVLQLCRSFGTEPAKTLVVGDYLYDLISAINAGAIGVLLKNHPQADDFAKHAAFVINRIDELIAIIENNNA